MSIEDALCDALLMEVGVRNLTGETPWQGSIEDARNLMRPWAQAIRESLQEDGYEILPARFVTLPSGMPNQTQTKVASL